jgi:hypothetical protein
MQNNTRIAIVVGVLVLAVAAFAYWGGFGGGTPQAIPEEDVRVFLETTRARVARSVATSSQAYEPWMFLVGYPGLLPQDFEGVEASVGMYHVEGGEVLYDPEGEENLNEASRAISDVGMQRLLENITRRLDLDLGGEDSLDEVFDSIESTP